MVEVISIIGIKKSSVEWVAIESRQREPVGLDLYGFLFIKQRSFDNINHNSVSQSESNPIVYKDLKHTCFRNTFS